MQRSVKLALALPVFLLFLLFSWPSAAHASNVVVTSGSVSVTGQATAPTLHFEGLMDGEVFTAEGVSFRNPTPNVGPRSCSPCQPGSTLNLNSFLLGFDYRGSASSGNTNYPTVYYLGQLNFQGSTVLPLDTSPLVTVTAPVAFTIQLTGHLNNPFLGDPGPAIFSLMLNGLGTATVELASIKVPSGSLYEFRSVRYDIQAVPEPATLLLLGTGLAGIIARSRRRRS